MTSQDKSTLTVFVALTVGLAAFALLGVLGWRAVAHAQAARARAQAQAAAAKAKAVQAAKDAQTKEAAASAESRTAEDRAATAPENAVPLDLTKYLVLTPENFEKIKQYPWAVTPRGKQNYAGAPLEIQGATILWGKRNADRGQNYPETIADIPCNQKFETLYILHCVFFEAAKGEPSFSTVLHYEDGSMQSDDILCGEDSKDWWVNDPKEALGPTAKRSTLAWKGTGKANGRDQDVRFCLTAIENKQPDRLVTTLDLVSSKKQAAGVILAISLGKSGLLMRKDE